MTEPFLGELRAFGFNFTPLGWASCAGQLLPIAQNTALFALLGTIYGGDGRVTFALPDLRGRVPIGFGQGAGLANYEIGEAGGAEAVTQPQDVEMDPATVETAGGGQPHENRPPYLAINWCIALEGAFPPRA